MQTHLSWNDTSSIEKDEIFICSNSTSCILFLKAFGFIFIQFFVLFVLQTHQSAQRTFLASTRWKVKKVESCSALGTEDETLTFRIVRCCGEFDGENQKQKHPICWSYRRLKRIFVCSRVRTVSGNHTVGPVHNISSKGTDSPSASFNVACSVQMMSVWVQTRNPLGSAESAATNYTLSDIGKRAAVSVGRWPECVLRFMWDESCVSHEITTILWLELLLCSNLEVYDVW